ncbi:hypothetical protein OOZ15_12835 [Galbibacter sp. EGI 63066]|uniref:DUF7010 family protein n=1 Tax=Galbibacter sp. EGI 63066 TaxID=2993559 RepID=UPI00224917A0|nr:hypothetical protein [Galbibacter sp. EGI 63066]MCX2680832.1 hypothetical protein [Galbibacter sp. EGI 63066]
MRIKEFEKLKRELQLNAKNGIDFIISAGIVWFGVYIIWTLDYQSYDKSVFTFIISALLLPLALGLSKLLKTNWKIKDNPLQPLGLWLNFAQLIYFPFLVFILIKYPDYFIMAYAVITGAHLFPYAWLYDEIGYAVTAVLISVGTLIITFNVDVEEAFYIPIFTSVALFLLAIWIQINLKRFRKKVLIE